MEGTTELFDWSGSRSSDTTVHKHYLNLALIRTDIKSRHSELIVELGVVFIQKYCFQNISHLKMFRSRRMDYDTEALKLWVGAVAQSVPG